MLSLNQNTYKQKADMLAIAEWTYRSEISVTLYCND